MKITRSTFLHLRIPFSYFLMPVFFLSSLLAPRIDWGNWIISFAVIHFLLYPAANGFNSFYDRDTSSIGGLKNPPEVESALLPVSLFLDLVAVLTGLLISWHFAVSVFLYGICSKLYSFDKIRLKRRPVISWLGTSLVQGGFIFLVVNFAVEPGGQAHMPSVKVLLGAGIASIFLMGYYPMTQIFQHEEDRKRGDRTMSMLLGTSGTFIFSGVILSIAVASLSVFLEHFYGAKSLFLFLLLQFPALVYFVQWYRSYQSGRCRADYDHTMRLSLIAASGMNFFYIVSCSHILFAKVIMAFIFILAPGWGAC